MQFSTTCPACGAAISLTSDSSHVSCPYCNRDFEADLSEASPVLKPTVGAPKEYTPSLEPDISEPEIVSAQPEGFEPVREPAPAEEIVSPVTEERPSYAAFEPPVKPSTPVQSATQKLGKWLWVLIGLLVLLCVSCVAGTAILVNIIIGR